MMKRSIIVVILLLSNSVFAAQKPIEQLNWGAGTVKPSVMQSTINSRLDSAQDNFTELYDSKETKAVVQASAPADTTVDWYDTDQEAGVLILKRHNGTTWVRASSHGVQYATSCASISAGMCVDTDDGKLYYHNGMAVVEVGTGDGSIPTASAETLGGVKIGSRLTIADGVLSADVQSGGFDPSADIDFTGDIDFSGATVTGISGTVPTGTENQIPVYNSSGAQVPTTPLTPVAGSNITLTTDANAGTVTIASTVSGGASDIADLTDWPNGLTATELGYVDGATSNLQAQISAISAGAGGTVTAITSEPYADVACTGAKYDTVANRFYPCIGGYHTAYLSGTAYSTASSDTAPDAFTFGDTQTDAALSTQYCSAAVTPTGFNASASIVSTGTGSNKGWKIDGGSFATTGTLSPGSAIQTCHDSSSSNSTSTTSSLTIGGVAATSPFTTTTADAMSYLLQDSFEAGSTGDNLTTVGWSGTTSENMEISSHAHGGSQAAHFAYTTSGENYRTFTQNTTGKITLDFWYWFDTTLEKPIIYLRSTATNSATNYISLLISARDIKYMVGGAYQTPIDANLALSTWHHFEVECDLDTGTWSVWVNDTNIISSVAKAYTASTYPIAVVVRAQSGETGGNGYIDDLTIREGAR